MVNVAPIVRIKVVLGTRKPRSSGGETGVAIGPCGCVTPHLAVPAIATELLKMVECCVVKITMW